jgi:hypothetical protein
MPNRAWDAVADRVPDRAVVLAAHQLLQRLASVTLPVVALAAIGRSYLTVAGMHSKAELPIARVKITPIQPGERRAAGRRTFTAPAAVAAGAAE